MEEAEEPWGDGKKQGLHSFPHVTPKGKRLACSVCTDVVMVMIVSISETISQRSETSRYSGRNGEDWRDALCYTHRAEVSSMEDWGLVIHSLSQGRRGWWMPSRNLSLLNPSITAHLGSNRLTQLDIIWQLQVSQQQPDAWENPWKINFKNLQSIMYVCTPTEFYFLISFTH